MSDAPFLLPLLMLSPLLSFLMLMLLLLLLLFSNAANAVNIANNAASCIVSFCRCCFCCCCCYLGSFLPQKCLPDKLQPPQPLRVVPMTNLLRYAPSSVQTMSVLGMRWKLGLTQPRPWLKLSWAGSLIDNVCCCFSFISMLPLWQLLLSLSWPLWRPLRVVRRTTTGLEMPRTTTVRFSPTKTICLLPCGK